MDDAHSAVVSAPWLALYDAGVPAEAMPRHATVLHSFLSACERDPDKDFIHYCGIALSYADADRWSDDVALELAGHGIVRGDRIAVYLQSVPQFVIAVVAAWKLRAIVVTVNPMYRERELAEVLRDSGAKVLFCENGESADMAQRVAANCGVAHVMVCDPHVAFMPASPGVRKPAPRDLPDPHDPATFIYTSGTTGPIKAAVSTHAQVAYSAEVYRSWADMSRGDVIVAIAPLVHVTGMIGYIALAMAASCSLVLTYRFTPAAFSAAVREHGGTFTIAPTTAFIALVAADDVEPSHLATLRKTYCGGAPIPAAVVQRYRAKFGQTILGIYGLTEATGPTHMVPRGHPAPIDTASGTQAVGLPVPGLDCRIVDDEGRVVPPGTPGEISLSGPQLASGYWQRPADNASTFMPDGLRTGDIGTMDVCGWLYVIDRKKDQINASGFKVWPREVEEVLYEHDAVLECAVVGVPDEYRGETVRAYVALRANRELDAPSLKAFCRERLAAYKIPRSIVFLPQLPKTASGKVLRRALRDTPAS